MDPPFQRRRGKPTPGRCSWHPKTGSWSSCIALPRRRQQSKACKNANERPEMEEAPREAALPSSPSEKKPIQKMPAMAKDETTKNETLDLGCQTVTGKPDPKDREEGVTTRLMLPPSPPDYESESGVIEQEEEEGKKKHQDDDEEHLAWPCWRRCSTDSIKTLQPPVSDYYTPMQPSPQPAYVLRGHTAAIHALEFLHGNTRLLSGDADGWVVLWDMPTRRPAAVWRAHQNAILGLAGWEHDKIITHGRDQKLCVWKLDRPDEIHMSKTLPAEEQQEAGSRSHWPCPWLLHVLEINTLNFCAFSMCAAQLSPLNSRERWEGASPIYLAVPNALNSGSIDVWLLPDEKRIGTIEVQTGKQTGMVMALAISRLDDTLYVAAGYESGHVMLFEHHVAEGCVCGNWRRTYLYQSHSQPVLSLAIAPSRDYFLASAADSNIAQHPVFVGKEYGTSQQPLMRIKTGHSGQQGLRVRSDGKIFATAGWDARIRVYSTATMHELAVLKWHSEGCYATAFAEVKDDRTSPVAEPSQASVESKSSLVSNSGRQVRPSERRRTQRNQSTHWLAGGSKDGKISLWDIY